MSKPFNERRRQQFLTESYSKAHEAYVLGERNYWKNALQAEGDSEQERRMLALTTHSNFAYELLSLQYTAGTPIEDLRNELMGVIEAYERYQKALSVYEGEENTSVFYFRELAHYPRLMQIIGLAYLLHRRDLLPRIAMLFDTNFYGRDALVEELLDYELPDRVDTDQMFHQQPYAHLVHAMFRDTDEERVEDLQKYVLDWYPAMKYAPWHDGHLRIDGTEGDYFGYWAFEAGAVALLCDIDDSAITHMVYPKDLVAWARANKALSEVKASDSTRLRCEANHPCPKEGWWFTPAKADSRRHFTQGETMPDLGSAWGSTIWQWDEPGRVGTSSVPTRIE